VAHAAAVHLVPELLLVVGEGRRIEWSLWLEARWPDYGQALGAVVQALDLNRQPARLVQHLRHEVGDTQRALGNAALVEHGLAILKSLAIARSHVGREVLNLVEGDDYGHGDDASADSSRRPYNPRQRGGSDKTRPTEGGTREDTCARSAISRFDADRIHR